MQRAADTECVIGFSTLYGSKWVATPALCSFSHAQSSSVSVPSTGRSGLQPEALEPLLQTLEVFQYPLRVEVGCNPAADALSDSSTLCFSTLYGSKWVATLDGVYLGEEPSACFSTLYGSKWVATPSGRARAKRFFNVSVPSTGRSGLQPSNLGCRHYFVLEFQYPLRVEVGCNLDQR